MNESKARLRHFTLVARDIERSARFYEQAFGLKRVGRDELPIGSGVYLTGRQARGADLPGARGGGRGVRLRGRCAVSRALRL